MTNALKASDQNVVPMNDNATLMSAIARAAADPQVDVEKMERLFAMHERMASRQAETAFNEAMNEAQSQIGRVAADRENKQTHSWYATYAGMDRALRPVYVSNGFALSFDTSADAPADHVRVVCYVSHKAGHTRTYHVDMPADGKGAKGGDVMTKTHATGSAMAYGSRYLLKLIFNVAIGIDPDDDDGNAAGNKGPQYNTADWEAAIEAASSKDDLDKIATELKGTKGVPEYALKIIRAAYSKRSKAIAGGAK